jgi:hypothetical protein
MAAHSDAHLSTLRRVLFSQLHTIQGKTLSEETVESLLLTCGDSMLLAALDLVDSADGKHCYLSLACLHLVAEPRLHVVSKIVTTAGRSLYRVRSSNYPPAAGN